MSDKRQKEGSNGKYGNYESSTGKMKQSEWDVQEVVRKAAKQWVDEANNNNVTRMLRESNEHDITIDKSDSRQEEVTLKSLEDDEAWQV